MIITINKIYAENNIEALSPYGKFRGKYYGENIGLNMKCDVEIEVSKIFRLCDFELDNENIYNITTSNGFTTITGLVQEIDNDVIYLKLGVNLIVLEIAPEIDYQSILNKSVCFTIDNLELYDTGLI